MRGTTWADTDDATLRRMWDAKEPVRNIATALGRTRASIIGRAYRLSLKDRSGEAAAKPVIIRGKPYKSHREAAYGVGVDESTVSLMVARGQQDRIGLGRWPKSGDLP